MPSARHPHVVEVGGTRMACYTADDKDGLTPEGNCTNPHPHRGHVRYLDEEGGPRRVFCSGEGAGRGAQAHQALLTVTGASPAGPLPPPNRPAVCAHDVRGPLRQACCCCGACDHIDFRVPDEVWAMAVPLGLAGGHVCLRCFDALAAERQVNYGDALSEVCFVGYGATVGFTVATVVNAPY